MQWDFWTLSPESAHQVTILMSNRGTPRTWRHMNGYSSHTYLWVNAAGERFWVQYHWKTVQGIESLTRGEAQAMKADDPDCHRRDLLEAIARGEAPEWRLEMQVMPYEDAADYRFNPFDITKVWPHADYPPIPIGRLVLDRNPENFFAEVEQAAFAPSNLVPGIGPSPDKMLMGRMFSYPDTHRYRIGPNYNQLPINSPHAPVRSYEIDGPMHYRHSGPEPTYAPNSRGGPQADERRAGEPTWWSDAAELGRYAYERHAGDATSARPGRWCAT
jgi:catalase